jgi:RimJ/RimL family protein N-acetyltransferase
MENSIITNRLLIEPLILNDSSFILTLVNTDGWIRFIGDRNISTNADALNYIQKILSNPNCTYWVVKLKDYTPVGIVTLIKRDYLEYPDIGFALLPGYDKQGYAYEASKQILSNIAAIGLYTKVQAITVKGNSNSISLLQKLGFTFEKEMVEDDEELLLYDITIQ